MTSIADITGGKYFRATDNESLKVIYKEIEKLEKRKILDKRYQTDPPANPSGFLNWALLLLVLTWSVKSILFRTNE